MFTVFGLICPIDLICPRIKWSRYFGSINLNLSVLILQLNNCGAGDKLYSCFYPTNSSPVLLIRYVAFTVRPWR